MKEAVNLAKLLRQLGWRVEVTTDGPQLKRTCADAEPLVAGVKKQLTVLKPDLIRLHTDHECGTCRAAVFDGLALAEANDAGPGAGCPFAYCPYRG